MVLIEQPVGNLDVADKAFENQVVSNNKKPAVNYSSGWAWRRAKIKGLTTSPSCLYTIGLLYS